MQFHQTSINFFIDIVTTSTWIKLQQLNVSKCGNLTDTALFSIIPEVGLVAMCSLNLAFCEQITDRSILHVAAHCPSLCDLNISNCKNVTDASLVELAKKCSIQKLVLRNCVEITDATLTSIASYCPALLLLDCSLCEKITDQGI
jgi:hypothetical protein